MKNIKYKFVFWLFLLPLIFICGCWDAKDLQNLAIVSAVGIDVDEKLPGKVVVTVQIIKPGEVRSASGGGGGGESSEGSSASQKPAYVMVSSSGNTISEVFQNFVHQVDRELYLSQNQIIVFGKEAARRGVYPYVDYFIRIRESRETTWILVAEGKASEILETNLGLEKIPAIAINRLVVNRELASQASGTTLHDFVSSMLSETSAAYTSLIQVTGTEDKKIRLAGTAVFKEDKFIGAFDKTETRGFLWVINKVKSGVITVKSARGEFNLDVLQANTKMVPEIRQGKVKIKLVINVQYGVRGTEKSEDFTKPDLTESLQILVGQAVRREVMAAVGKAFQFDADVFGFGEAVHRKFPKEWEKMKPEWEQQFLMTDVRVKTNNRQRTIGLNVKALLPDTRYFQR